MKIKNNFNIRYKIIHEEFISYSFFIWNLLTSNAQLQNDDTRYYENKIDSYSKMRKSGLVLLGTGNLLNLGGLVYMARSDWDKTSTGTSVNYSTNESDGVIGLLGVAIGISLTITGIILNSVGNKKMKFYREKLEDVDVGTFQKGQQKGITLAVRF